MFKKSLVLSIAVLLTAVLFVFTGCEGPAGPIGQTGNDGSDVPFPGEITVTIPGSGVPELPAGVTYPPLSGAKILSGNAADISKAFNGGILVANTPDSGALGGGTNEGTVYAQDAVDYVVWTGPGIDTGTPTWQGAIVVPPGKTLFIAAPLFVNGAANSFTGITVSDKGTFAPTAVTASVQAATGGTTVDQNSPEGKIVILNGGSIRGTAGDITIGGTLEIHHGAYISVGGATFLSTAKSTVDVYGSIVGSTAALSFEGDLTIKGGGTVVGSNVASDIFRGTVTVDSYGSLNLGNPASGNVVHFYGPVTVNENAGLNLNSSVTGDNPVTFHDVTAISGVLDAQRNDVTVLPAGHLKITATGEINANAWAQINSGTDVSLLAAIAPGAAPSALNNYTTIDIPTEGKVTLRVGEIRATSYANLVLLAAHPSLSLRASPFAVAQGVVATHGMGPGEFIIGPADVPLVVSSNDVTLTNYPLVTDLTVGEGRTLTLSGTALASAGEITVLGTFNAGSASFATRLDKLTVGSDTVKAPELTLGSAIFNADPTEIIVNSGSELILGGGSVAVNPAGTIFLDDNASLSVASTTGATLARLQKLTIDPGASFTSVSTDVTFAGLEELTVDGTLTALLHSTDPKFTYLETNSNDEGGKGEVGGGGAAVFGDWAVDGDDNKHAFDQLLAIRDLTVLSIENVSNTSGGGSLQTPDAGSPTGSNIILRVTDITAPAGGLTIDRDLNVGTDGTIDFGVAENTVTINAGSRILVGDAVAAAPLGNPGLSATAPAVLVAGSGSATVLTETSGALVVSADTVTVQAGSTLNVDGTFTAGSAGAEIIAGLGDNEITLVNGSSLTKGIIKSNAASAGNATAEITVNPTGVLAIADDSTVEKGSSVKILAAGSITTATNTALTFGTSGVSIGEAATSTAGELSAISESTITADGTDDGNIAITGALRASKGSSILTGAAGKEITLTGSVTLRNAGTAYDSLTLTGARLADVVVFNADNAVIDLTGTLTGQSNGSISTKGITAGKGALNIGAVAVLTATGTSAQSLSGVILNGTAGSLTGSLSLGTGSTLAIPNGQTLLVGTYSVTTTSGTISVGTGTVTLGNASKITLAQLATGVGTLSFNTYSLKGVASGGPAGSDTTASTVPNGSTITLTSSDIAGAFGKGGTPGTLTSTAAAVVTGSDAITITATSGGNTISGTSKLYSSD
jgi:hypothetical protein